MLKNSINHNCNTFIIKGRNGDELLRESLFLYCVYIYNTHTITHTHTNTHMLYIRKYNQDHPSSPCHRHVQIPILSYPRNRIVFPSLIRRQIDFGFQWFSGHIIRSLKETIWIGGVLFYCSIVHCTVNQTLPN